METGLPILGACNTGAHGLVWLPMTRWACSLLAEMHPCQTVEYHPTHILRIIYSSLIVICIIYISVLIRYCKHQWMPTFWLHTQVLDAHPSMCIDHGPSQTSSQAMDILHTQLVSTHCNLTYNNPQVFPAQNRSHTAT